MLQTCIAGSRQVKIAPDRWRSLQTGGAGSRQVEIAPERWGCLQTVGAASRQLGLPPHRFGLLQIGDLSIQEEIFFDRWSCTRQVLRQLMSIKLF